MLTLKNLNKFSCGTGGKAYFLKNLGASLFNKYLSNEPNISAGFIPHDSNFNVIFLLLERKHALYCSVGEETGKITSEAEQFGIVGNSQYWFRKLCPLPSPAQAHLFMPESEFVNVETAQESITRNQFRQHMKPKLGPVRQIGLLYQPARLHRMAESIPVFHKRLQIWAQHFRWDCPGNKRSFQRRPKNNSGKERLSLYIGL